jgi:hypothetical protein
MNMRFFRTFLILNVAAVAFVACDEEPPGVILTDTKEKPLLDTTYTVTAPAADLKTALIIDITGVRCNNCPEAAISAKNIMSANPGRVITMALFPKVTPDVLTRPWPGYDTLVSDEAYNLISLLGSITSLPTGTVDQVKSGGSFFIPHTGWAAEVNKRLLISSPINLNLSGKWNATDKKSRLEVRATYNTTVAGANPHLLNIAIIENKIIGKQSNKDTAGGIQYHYEFDHVFRRLITPTTGDTIRTAAEGGKVTEKHFYISPRYNWKPENLYAVVWITDATTKEVIQASEVHLK